MCPRISLASIHSHGIKERALVRRSCFIQNVVITSLTWSVLVTILPLLGTCINIPLKYINEMITQWTIYCILKICEMSHMSNLGGMPDIFLLTSSKAALSWLVWPHNESFICTGCAKYWFSWPHLSNRLDTSTEGRSGATTPFVILWAQECVQSHHRQISCHPLPAPSRAFSATTPAKREQLSNNVTTPQ